MNSNFIYEVTVVFAPKTEEKTTETVFSKLESMWIAATLEKKEHLGSKELSYAIKGNKKGDFWTLTFTSDKTLKLNEANLFLNREPSVIRYLVIKK
ncbi:MAG: 30S ribosomal protein S6 [Candidatus Shapirobacteria bacterium]